MDLLFIAGCPPYPLEDDLRALMFHLAQELSSHRQVLDLACFYQEPEELADIPRYETYFRKLHVIKPPRRDLAGRLKSAKARYPAEAEQAWSAEMWQTVQNLVRTSHYDVVHLFGDVDIYEYFPLVESFPTIISIPERQPTQKRQQELLRQYESWMYRGFHAVTTQTQETAAALQTLNPDLPVSTMLPGVNIDYFSPTGYEPETPALLFVADYADPINKEAALSLCREIFPIVKNTISEAQLYIVGANPPAELMKLASDAITITGQVPDLRPFFELATVYISPILTYSGYHREILQALAMMKAVVATPPSCVGLILLPDQEVLHGKTPAELAKQVIRLLQDDQLRLKFQINGRQRIDKSYSWEEISENYLELYRSLMPRH